MKRAASQISFLVEDTANIQTEVKINDIRTSGQGEKDLLFGNGLGELYPLRKTL